MTNSGGKYIHIIESVDKIIELFITVLFVLMVLVGGMQVFNRFILNQSLSWSEEFQKFSHIWLIFLTIPVAYNRGSHIGMKILFNKFSFRIQRIMDVIFDMFWLILGGAVIYYTLIIMEVAKSQTSAGLGLRMDWVYLGLVIGGIYLVFVSLRKISTHIGQLFTKEEGIG